MDRKWMSANRLTKEYEDGVKAFVRFAVEHAENPSRIICPCLNCCYIRRVSAAELKVHLVCHGIDQSYTCWTRHGETKDTKTRDKSSDNDVGYASNDIDTDAYEGVLPTRTYEAKQMLRSIGMDYKRIHACENDCILFWNEYASLKVCPKCNASRYKKEDSTPAKVLWYFPIKSRFKRMYSSEKDAKNLTWHADERIKDGKLQHPADSPQWRKIDHDYPSFAEESRNLRLALSTDGINPHGIQSTSHSTWPVMLVIYNLPPWLCMKRKFMMLSMLISGPKQPGNDIDIYLAPLIEDLKQLWETGIEVYDGYRKESFNLRALLFGTISDFPAYGNLSGYSTKGQFACPICEDSTHSIRLENYKKNVFLGHRRFLNPDHHYRRWRKVFNGNHEEGKPPLPLTGEQLFEKVSGLSNNFGKPFAGELVTSGWKKRSIFFELPYWKSLYVRHFLDVVHIEKNIFESLLGTLLNVPGKTKDGLNARLDLLSMGIRKELGPIKKGKRTFLPPAAYTLSRKEKIEFCKFLHGVKVPEGYSSNIRNLVSMKDLKLKGLKSHDCQVLMEHFLSIGIRSILPKKVRGTITKLCLFFQAVCSKVIDPGKLPTLQREIVVTLLNRVSVLESNNQEKDTERQHDLPYSGPSIKDSCTLATYNIPEGVTTCKLYLDAPLKRLVGIGKVHNLNAPLPPNHVKVGIDIALDDDALLPVPIEDTNMIGGAIGTFVAWLIHLVVVESKVSEEPKLKGKESQETKASITSPVKDKGKFAFQVPNISNVKAKQVNPINEPIRNKERSVIQVPKNSKKSKFCNLLKMHVEAMRDNVEINITMPKNIFGYDTEEFISLNEVNEIVNHQWLSSSVICIYIRYLYQNFVKDKKPVMFLSPQKTSHLMKEGTLGGKKKKEGQPQYIAHVLEENKDKEFFLAPYNIGHHWVLIVINRIEEQIYYLDSLVNANPNTYPDMKEIFTSGLQIYRTQNQSKATSNNIKWIHLKCPYQDNSNDCGYYVMYFMREIIEQCQNKRRLPATLCHFKCIIYSEDMLNSRNSGLAMSYILYNWYKSEDMEE